MVAACEVQHVFLDSHQSIVFSNYIMLAKWWEDTLVGYAKLHGSLLIMVAPNIMRSSHGLLLTCMRSSHGLLLTCMRSSHGLLLTCMRSSHGLS